MFGSKKTVAGLAADYGLTYVSEVGPHSDDVEAMNLDGTRKDVAETVGGLRAQFGNHGTKYWIGDSDNRPSRRGYIAVQHGLQVPRMYLESFAFGAVTPLNVASTVLNFVSIFDNAEGATSQAPSQVFYRQSETIKLPKGAGFRPQCERGRVEEGRALLTTDAMAILKELARSFDVEVRDGWLLAYSSYGDITTKDPEVWEWAFGATSRMIDLVRLWGADAHFAAEWSHYTAEWVPRPKSLDGTLGFLKRSD